MPPKQQFAQQQGQGQLGVADVIAQFLSRQQQVQLPQTRGLLPRKDISGNVEGTVPRGLDKWYQNNPGARAGEFDPNGAKQAARRNTEFATQDLARNAQYADALTQFDAARGQFEQQNNGDLQSALVQGILESMQQGVMQPNRQRPTLPNVAPQAPAASVRPTPMAGMQQKQGGLTGLLNFLSDQQTRNTNNRAFINQSQQFANGLTDKAQNVNELLFPYKASKALYGK